MPEIGVLIDVPDPFGEQLREVRAEFGDPLADIVPSHVTLLPPVEVSDARWDGLDDALAGAAAQIDPYPIRLRSTGTFRPVSPVVFVAVSLGISCTELLAGQVRAAVGGLDLEFPYHPHVTVAQDLDDATLDRAYEQLRDFECEFTVEHFTLYRRDGDAWEPSSIFALGS